jgi:Domain of unknown function (DUF4336)
METHLTLDLLGALTLCGAGTFMRRHPVRERSLLFGLGLAELAVIILSDVRIGQQHPMMAYPPLDAPKPVANDLWIVDSTISPGAPVRMTIVRLPGDDLLLHSPTRFSPALQRDLERLGRIRHLVAPNISHWTFIKPWQDRIPGTITWAAPGLRRRRQVRRSGLRIDHNLTDHPPPAWAGQIEQTIVPGGAGFREVAMFHRPSRTLLLTDLLLNLEPQKVPWLLRPVAGLLGILAPLGRAPAYLRAVVQLNRTRAMQAACRLPAWAPERVIFPHGRWFDRAGTRQLRESLSWLIDPGRA